MQTIYIIVENIVVVKPDDKWGEHSTEEITCPQFGFFLNVGNAEAKVLELNQKYRQEIYDDDNWMLVGDEERQEIETHYGFIPLERNEIERKDK